MILPAGRWVMPDDWPVLAGANWQQRRLHWDIMNSPNEPAGFTVYGYPSPLGSYWKPTPSINLVAAANVIGPFSPGLEVMTPTGWNPNITSVDPLRMMKTVVPNSALDKWDAPMPPAKIIVQLNSGNGYFKYAAKKDIYYVWSSSANTTQWFTNPFYQQMIPAHEAIPAFVNNGGYDWDSFGSANATQMYGPYEFWTIINRPDSNPLVATSDPANHPTKVEVYADNHGEAMVYLNGDWNLSLLGLSNGGHDILTGTVVGTSVVQAMADYPYLRKHTPIISNTLTKTWTWGLMILGANPNTYPIPYGGTDPSTTRMVIQTGTLTGLSGTYPWETAMSQKKMMWIWITDRDGQRAGAVNVPIDFYIDPLTPAIIAPATGVGVSNYNWITGNISLTDGLLTNYDPLKQGTVDSGRTHGHVWTRIPTSYEIALFEKFFPHSGLTGLNSSKFAVAGVEIFSSGSLPVHVSSWIQMPREGLIIRNTNMDFNVADLADDQLPPGDANMDGSVNMGDVVAVERIILGLGLKTATSDANQNYSIDMGDVVRIERNILGLK
jgi:hypothetical protein